jgi:hypothetical protein
MSSAQTAMDVSSLFFCKAVHFFFLPASSFSKPLMPLGAFTHTMRTAMLSPPHVQPDQHISGRDQQYSCQRRPSPARYAHEQQYQPCRRQHSAQHIQAASPVTSAVGWSLSPTIHGQSLASPSSYAAKNLLTTA